MNTFQDRSSIPQFNFLLEKTLHQRFTRSAHDESLIEHYSCLELVVSYALLLLTNIANYKCFQKTRSYLIIGGARNTAGGRHGLVGGTLLQKDLSATPGSCSISFEVLVNQCPAFASFIHKTNIRGVRPFGLGPWLALTWGYTHMHSTGAGFVSSVNVPLCAFCISSVIADVNHAAQTFVPL